MIDKIKHFATKEKLHTDFLEEKYWPILVDVLRHDNVKDAELSHQDRIREVRMIDKQNILRTYAITFLTYDKNDFSIADIDEKIRNWWLIGKTFRENWYIVKKNVVDVFVADIPERLRKDFHTDHAHAKTRITEFYAKTTDSKSAPVVYGIVCEVYSPDFRNPDDGINTTDLAQINPLTGTLQDSGIPRDIIWDRLDHLWKKDLRLDIYDKYTVAQQSSRPMVDMLRKRFIKYINDKIIL